MNTFAKRVLLGIAAFALAAAPALAADDTLTAKNAAGTTITVCSKDVGAGVMAACHAVVNTAGTKIDPATSGNQATQITSLASLDGKAVAPFAATATTTITRPADALVYAANDTLANSTSAATTGGFTLSSVCSASGKTSIITSLAIVSSVDPTTLLQGEIWLFDSAVTAVNDNVAFAISDTDALKVVPGGVVPFTLASTAAGSGTNSAYTASGLNIGFTCVGTADARFLVKVKNAYTPASGETLTMRATVVGAN